MGGYYFSIFFFAARSRSIFGQCRYSCPVQFPVHVNRHAFPAAANIGCPARIGLLNNMRKTITHALGDRAGVIVATLCFIHCVAGPAMIAFGGFSSLIAFSERTEILFMLASATIGTTVLLPGYRRRHRRRSCLAMFGSGMAALLAHRYAHRGLAEPAMALTGTSLIIGAHILNHRYSRVCSCCESASNIQAVESSSPSKNLGSLAERTLFRMWGSHVGSLQRGTADRIRAQQRGRILLEFRDRPPDD